MPEQSAHVSSIEALEYFRSSFLVFLGKSRPALEDVADEITRMRLWLQTDRRLHWESQVRARHKACDRAHQALFASNMAHLRTSNSAAQLEYHRAKRALDEAEEKLKKVKYWTREFDSRVEPLAKQLDPLRHLLGTEMPKAAATLHELIKKLEDYADLGPAPVSAAVATDPPPTGETAPDAPPAAPSSLAAAADALQKPPGAEAAPATPSPTLEEPT